MHRNDRGDIDAFIRACILFFLPFLLRKLSFFSVVFMETFQDIFRNIHILQIEPITASAKTDTKEEPNTEDKEATTKPISTSLTPAEADVDVLKKRAERFGQVLSSSLSKVDEDERIRKRKERFGEITTATNNTPKIAKITVNANPADQPYNEEFFKLLGRRMDWKEQTKV
ncbi:hypothetical protein MAR_006153 [Mya arenaria]|uniref:THO1-MOS11 C-terminal domain-containing protein n=1 Tax=Mya arenaria TaxID=6604 RepID=A0ABY7D7N2_MYAAR|nr:hypothetical protein MAR_006153 [Mya arenaria]